MAIVFSGPHTIGPNSTVVWYRAYDAGDVSVGSPYPIHYRTVVPTSPTGGGPANWAFTGDGYPYVQTLGTGTQWYQLSDDALTLYVFTIVQNNGSQGIVYYNLEVDM